MAKGQRTKFTVRQFLDAIPGTGGVITAIAAKVGCTWTTAQKYIKQYPKITAAYEDERSSIVDMAETVLLRSIKGGNTQDAKWFLERKRKGEYSLRREIAIEARAVQAMSDEELDAFLDGLG